MIFADLGLRFRPLLLILGGVAWLLLVLGAVLDQATLGRLGIGLLLATPWALVATCAVQAARRGAWRLFVVSGLLLGLAAVAAFGGLGGR